MIELDVKTPLVDGVLIAGGTSPEELFSWISDVFLSTASTREMWYKGRIWKFVKGEREKALVRLDKEEAFRIPLDDDWDSLKELIK